MIANLTVVGCRHCSNADAVWIENKPGKPPDIVFKRFPTHGRLLLTNQVIWLYCQECVQEGNLMKELLLKEAWHNKNSPSSG